MSNCLIPSLTTFLGHACWTTRVWARFEISLGGTCHRALSPCPPCYLSTMDPLGGGWWVYCILSSSQSRSSFSSLSLSLSHSRLLRSLAWAPYAQCCPRSIHHGLPLWGLCWGETVHDLIPPFFCGADLERLQVATPSKRYISNFETGPDADLNIFPLIFWGSGSTGGLFRCMSHSQWRRMPENLGVANATKNKIYDIV